MGGLSEAGVRPRVRAIGNWLMWIDWACMGNVPIEFASKP
jgi:hypothetical protein